MSCKYQKLLQVMRCRKKLEGRTKGRFSSLMSAYVWSHMSWWLNPFSSLVFGLCCDFTEFFSVVLVFLCLCDVEFASFMCLRRIQLFAASLVICCLCTLSAIVYFPFTCLCLSCIIVIISTLLTLIHVKVFYELLDRFQ